MLRRRLYESSRSERISAIKNAQSKRAKREELKANNDGKMVNEWTSVIQKYLIDSVTNLQKESAELLQEYYEVDDMIDAYPELSRNMELTGDGYAVRFWTVDGEPEIRIYVEKKGKNSWNPLTRFSAYFVCVVITDKDIWVESSEDGDRWSGEDLDKYLKGVANSIVLDNEDEGWVPETKVREDASTWVNFLKGLFHKCVAAIEENMDDLLDKMETKIRG